MRRPLSAAERAVVLAAIVAVALLLRVGFVLETVVTDPIRADATHYVVYACNLLRYGVFSLEQSGQPVPDSFRSPGYPVFLLLHLLLCGEGGLYLGARLTQAVLDTGTVLLAFTVARGVLPAWAALAAAALTACSPHLVANTGYLLTETLTTFALTLGLWALLRLASGTGSGLLCGGAFAVATLTNQALVPLPFLLGFVVLRRRPPAPAASRRGILVALGLCAACHAGWVVRNACSVPPGAPHGSTRALQTISHGSYPGFVYRDPRWRYMAEREDPEQPRYGQDPAHFARVFAARVAERPLRYLSWYLVEKPYHLWGFDGLQATREIYSYPPSRTLYDEHAAAGATLWLMRGLHWPVVALALLGVLAVLRRGRARDSAAVQARLLALCLLYGTALGVVFAPWPRYVIPLRPVLFTIALYGAWSAWRICARRPTGAADGGGGWIDLPDDGAELGAGGRGQAPAASYSLSSSAGGLSSSTRSL